MVGFMLKVTILSVVSPANCLFQLVGHSLSRPQSFEAALKDTGRLLTVSSQSIANELTASQTIQVVRDGSLPAQFDDFRLIHLLTYMH